MMLSFGQLCLGCLGGAWVLRDSVHRAGVNVAIGALQAPLAAPLGGKGRKLGQASDQMLVSELCMALNMNIAGLGALVGRDHGFCAATLW